MSRFLVGGRVLKTVLAVTLAMFIAQHFEMERTTLAAIVALLTVQRTFYHSILQSMAKLGSVLLGGLLGTAVSHFFGLSPIGYGLVTLLAIYICLQLRWQDHIVLTTITAVTVIFSSDGVPLTFSLLQILTAMVGAISGLTVNFLFNPNHTKEVKQTLDEVESGLRRAVDFIMFEMLKPGCDDTEFKAEIKKLDASIDEGLTLAKLLQEEQRFIVNRETDADRYRHTFQIASSQLKRLEEMHILARQIPIRVHQALPLVRLFRIVQKMQYRRVTGRKNHNQMVEQLMEKLEKSFELMDLPKTREEFISRASLFHLFQEIKRYYKRMQTMPPAVLSKKDQIQKDKLAAASLN